MSFGVELTLKVHFDAAHFMPTFPEGHPNRRLHGHSYTAEFFFEGSVNSETGYLYEVDDLRSRVQEVVRPLDHVLLNEVSGLGLPTAENLARYLFLETRKKFSSLKKVAIHRAGLGLTVSYSGQELKK